MFYWKRGLMTNQRQNVEGMTCEHCAQTIKDAVNKLDGINQIEVELKNKQVFVEFNKAQTGIENIKNKIIEIRYEIK